MTTRTTTQHLQHQLSEYLERVSGAHTFGCEWVASNTPGLTRDLAKRHGAQRVHLTPVSARAAIGAATGTALAGAPAVLHLPDTECLRRGADLLRGLPTDSGNVATTFVIRAPYGAEAIGVDIPAGAWLDALPAKTEVLCPSDAEGAQRGLRHALSRRGLTILLEPRQLSADRSSECSDGGVGSRTLREGGHVTLISWGGATAACLDAADTLAGDGVHATVLDLERIWPLDADSIGEAARKTGRAVIVHNHDPLLAQRVHAAVVEEAFLYLEAPPQCSTSDSQHIVQAALAAVRY